MNVTEAQVYKSKWGYHPCSKEIAQKLRTINRVYQKALHLEAAHERWRNKLPENRRGEEPQRCPIFEFTYHWPGQGKRPYRVSKVGEAIRLAARQARTPVATPEDVKRPAYGYGDGSEEAVCRLYEQCAAWESSQ